MSSRRVPIVQFLRFGIVDLLLLSTLVGLLFTWINDRLELSKLRNVVFDHSFVQRVPFRGDEFSMAEIPVKMDFSFPYRIYSQYELELIAEMPKQKDNITIPINRAESQFAIRDEVNRPINVKYLGHETSIGLDPVPSGHYFSGVGEYFVKLPAIFMYLRNNTTTSVVFSVQRRRQ